MTMIFLNLSHGDSAGCIMCYSLSCRVVYTNAIGFYYCSLFGNTFIYIYIMLRENLKEICRDIKSTEGI